MKVHIRRAIWQGLAIVAVAGVAAVLTAKLHPRAPALYLTEDVTDSQFRLSIIEIRQRYTPEQLIWIDARNEERYLKEHLDGAHHLSDENWADQMWELRSEFENLDGRAIIVYCDGERCKRSSHIAKRLRGEAGLEPVWILRGDWRDW
jgi:rhodanese-related sulfurtransferase